MDTSDTIALIALIVSSATLLVYAGQLLVLTLIYMRVIKETNQNAKERQATIEAVGEKWQKAGKDLEENLNKMARRNTLGMAAIGIISAYFLFKKQKEQ